MYALSTYDTRSFDFHEASVVRFDWAFSVQWFTKGVDYASEQGFTHRNVQNTTRSFDDCPFGDLFDFSEEGGSHECLGILSGRIVRFPHGLTVPHIGWNTVHVPQTHPIFEDIPQDSYFYFVHSYHAEPNEPMMVIGTTEYEGWEFPSVVGRGNMIATQFHPEKSGPIGLKFYANFIRLARERGSIAPEQASAALA